MSADLAALRAYVTADTGAQQRAESTVLLTVTHSNLRATFMELRFDLHMTVLHVKEKLQSHVGSSVGAMRLQLKDERGTPVAVLDDDSRKLGYYSPRDGFTLHVIDVDAHSASAGGWLEDVSKVEKYTISDEAYAQRENTFRKYREDKLRQDPTWTLQKEMDKRRGEEAAGGEAPADDSTQAAEAAGIAVGSRCEVQPGGKRGQVMYVGNTQAVGLPRGWWVGVRYDEPVGKNDGSFGGVRLFECPPHYGALIRPAKVTTGDFPEIDVFAEEDEM